MIWMMKIDQSREFNMNSKRSFYLMAANIMANGIRLQKKDMAVESRFGEMEQYTKDIGKMARPMVEAG